MLAAWDLPGVVYATKAQGQVFNRTIVVTFDQSGKAAIAKNVWQHLRPTDRDLDAMAVGAPVAARKAETVGK